MASQKVRFIITDLGDPDDDEFGSTSVVDMWVNDLEMTREFLTEAFTILHGYPVTVLTDMEIELAEGEEDEYVVKEDGTVSSAPPAA